MNDYEKLWQLYQESNIHGDKEARNYALWQKNYNDEEAQDFAKFVEGYKVGYVEAQGYDKG